MSGPAGVGTGQGPGHWAGPCPSPCLVGGRVRIPPGLPPRPHTYLPVPPSPPPGSPAVSPPGRGLIGCDSPSPQQLSGVTGN